MTRTRSRFNKEQKKVVLQEEVMKERILMLFINRSLRVGVGGGGRWRAEGRNKEAIKARSGRLRSAVRDRGARRPSE